jgi:hypothetical protein
MEFLPCSKKKSLAEGAKGYNGEREDDEEQHYHSLILRGRKN